MFPSDSFLLLYTLQPISSYIWPSTSAFLWLEYLPEIGGEICFCPLDRAFYPLAGLRREAIPSAFGVSLLPPGGRRTSFILILPRLIIKNILSFILEWFVLTKKKYMLEKSKDPRITWKNKFLKFWGVIALDRKLNTRSKGQRYRRQIKKYLKRDGWWWVILFALRICWTSRAKINQFNKSLPSVSHLAGC